MNGWRALRRLLRLRAPDGEVGAIPPEEKARREAERRHWEGRARVAETLAELQAGRVRRRE